MEVLALRRRRRFASREAALESFAGKPPFSAFRRDALREYVAHGLRDAPGVPEAPLGFLERCCACVASGHLLMTGNTVWCNQNK